MSVVLLHQNIQHMDEDLIAKLEAAAQPRELIASTDPTEYMDRIEEVEIIAGHPSAEVLFAAENCRWVQIFSAGADALLMKHPEARDMDFQLTNVSGIHAISITEHIFSLLLTLARSIHVSIRAQADRDWVKHDHADVQEVAGTTMCLIGVGSIGSRVARTAHAMNMTVLGVRRHEGLDMPQGIAEVYGPDQLGEAMGRADWVVCCAPHTPGTHELVQEEHFRAMQPHAHFINIGRGKVVVEPALVRALQEGWIKGAGLDVTYEEPLPADSPLWDMGNVIVTSHYSGQSESYGERATEVLLDNLVRFNEGRPLNNLVDKKLGY